MGFFAPTPRNHPVTTKESATFRKVGPSSRFRNSHRKQWERFHSKHLEVCGNASMKTIPRNPAPTCHQVLGSSWCSQHPVQFKTQKTRRNSAVDVVKVSGSISWCLFTSAFIMLVKAGCLKYFNSNQRTLINLPVYESQLANQIPQNLRVSCTAWDETKNMSNAGYLLLYKSYYIINWWVGFC